MVDFYEIDSFISENESNIFRDIARLVAINSVKGDVLPDAPYGIGPKRALCTALEIASELGLDTVNCDNRIGYAEIKGECDDYLATITHVDVVPVNDGWTSDPFIMREKDGWIIGRGVQDDKGPAIISLYTLKYIKDAGIKLKYGMRALLGADEESGMDDVDYYMQCNKAPLFAFSPDADFPLVYGEKGLCHGKIVSRCKFSNIIDIKGGFAINVVPDKAEAWVKASNLLSTEKVTSVKEGDIWHLTASGIGGHASAPQGTDNAIGNLVEFILENNLIFDEEKEFFDFLSCFHSDTNARNVNAYARDEMFGDITLVGGMIYMDNGSIIQTYDSRYPATTSASELASAMQKKAGSVAEVIICKDACPFYVNPENPVIKACIDTYNEVTGENAKPFTIGGATYSRHFPSAVSFGPEHPERPSPDFAGPIHGVDEAACKAWLLESLKIYIAAIVKLQDVEY